MIEEEGGGVNGGGHAKRRRVVAVSENRLVGTRSNTYRRRCNGSSSRVAVPLNLQEALMVVVVAVVVVVVMVAAVVIMTMVVVEAVKVLVVMMAVVTVVVIMVIKWDGGGVKIAMWKCINPDHIDCTRDIEVWGGGGGPARGGVEKHQPRSH